MTTKSQSHRTWLRRKAFRDRHYLHREWGKCVAGCRKEGNGYSRGFCYGLIIPTLRLGWSARWIFTADARMWNNSRGNHQHVGSATLRDLQGYRESCRRRRIHFGIVGSRYLRRGIAVDISWGSEIDRRLSRTNKVRCTSGIYRSSLASRIARQKLESESAIGIINGRR